MESRDWCRDNGCVAVRIGELWRGQWLLLRPDGAWWLRRVNNKGFLGALVRTMRKRYGWGSIHLRRWKKVDRFPSTPFVVIVDSRARDSADCLVLDF